MLRSLSCSNCGGSGLELQSDGKVACRYCGSPYAASGPICPQCEEINPSSAEFCQSCGLALYQVCPACQTKNWSGAEICVKCGRELDLLTQLAERGRRDTAARLEEQQRLAPLIKEAEMQTMRRLSEQFSAAEARRQEELNIALLKRRQRERLIMTMAIIVSLLFCTILGAVVLLSLVMH